MSDTTIDAEVAHDDHADHGDHPTEKQYWIIFAVLAVLTAVEVLWSYLGLSGPALVLPLIGMMVVKFILVAGIFMHLKFDLSIRNGSVFSYMFALRLIPLFPFAAVNIAPALLGAKYRDYAITTFFGIIPGTLAYTWIGAAVKGTLLEGGTPDIGSLASNFLPAFIALGIVALIPAAYKKLFPKKAPANV